MAGKRIEDLPAYGAIDTTKYKKDIYEVSKNSGTYGAPVYDPADSKQKTLEELAADIGAILPGGYIPLLEDSYLVVTQTDDPLESGENLRDAIAYAQAATPGGNPLDAQNRFTVLLFPGIYDLDATGINGASALSNYVDIVGIGDAKDITIKSSDANGVFEVVSGSDYVLKNFTIRSTHISPLAIKFSAAATDNGIWIDLILYGKTTEGTEFAGTYEGLNCQADEILNGSISGTVKNCLFASFSCGYNGGAGAVTISGKILNCIAVGSRCFGYTNSGLLTISGEIVNCIAAGVSFGATNSGSLVISGKILNCIAAPTSFPSSSFGYSTTGDVTISGDIMDCKSSGYSFGHSSNDNVIISGRIINCHLVYNPDDIINNFYAFGAIVTGGILEISGTIEGCTSNGDFCFGSCTGTITISGTIRDCKARQKSFGYRESGASHIVISGTIERCNISIGQAFGCNEGTGNVNLSGKIINCHMGSSLGFVMTGAGNATIEATGEIKDCSAVNNCFGRSDAGNVDISGKIIHCSFFNSSCGHSSAGSVDISGYIFDCIANGQNNYGIGVVSSSISGTIKKCIIGSQSLGRTTADGKIISCEIISTATSQSETQEGTIEYCNIIVDDDVQPAFKLGEGARIRYCTIQQDGAGDCLFGLGINAEISYCKMNKVPVGITNSIVGGYNIGDGFVGTYFTMKSPDGTTWKFECGDDGVIVMPGTVV